MLCFFLLLHLRGAQGWGEFCIHFLNLPIRGCLAASLPTPTYCREALLLARSLWALVQEGLGRQLGHPPTAPLEIHFQKVGK